MFQSEFNYNLKAKKMTKKFLLGIIAAAAMVGCIKRESFEPQAGDGYVRTFGTSGTISGTVYISTNYVNDTNYSNLNNVPWEETYTWEQADAANILITLYYDRNDVDPDYSGDYPNNATMTTTTDASGNFSFSGIQVPEGGELPVRIEYENVITRTITDSLYNWNTAENELVTYDAEFNPDDWSKNFDIVDGADYSVENNWYWED